jgi:hypothetical protein
MQLQLQNAIPKNEKKFRETSSLHKTTTCKAVHANKVANTTWKHHMQTLNASKEMELTKTNNTNLL